MASVAELDRGGDYSPTPTTLTFRFLAWCVVATLFTFLLNTYLSFWQGWPGAGAIFGAGAGLKAWVQALIYVAGIAGPAVFVKRTPGRSLREDDFAMTAIATYIVKVAFWIVMLVGIVDAAVSFLRVEGLLPGLFGEEATKALGRNQFRAPWIHGPLIIAAFILAARIKSMGFQWLALLVVVAELQIVISRFIFSYEQAFMGDLVRFWYASLFLLASAYSLVDEGHVRVDVFYTGFSERGKARTNAVGSMLLGVPLCWVILTMGMWSKGSSLSSPLLSFEVSQSGFGMYVKYLMAGFLIIFAASMVAQFASYFLESVAVLRRPEPEKTDDAPHAESVL